MTDTALRIVVPGASDRENPPTVALDIVRGHAKNRHRQVSSPAYLIGRATDCDLVLGDQQFPEVHAYLLLRGTRVVLQHLGFAPQMTVNGKVAAKTDLADGDRIRTGPYEFVVRIHHPADGGRQESSDESPDTAAACCATRPDYDSDVVAIVEQLLADIRVETAPTSTTGESPLRIFTPRHAG